MPIEGDLKEINLTSVVQMLCMERRRAVLRLRRRGEEGSIFFDKGQIVHATLGYLQGEEACYQMLSWIEGLFRITNPLEEPPKTIRRNWSHILLEGSRKLDEKREHDSRVIEIDRQQLKADIAFDHSLEENLLSLLGELEQKLDQIKAKRTLKKPTKCLEILEEAINRIVVFAESIDRADPRAISLEQMTKRLQASYPEVGLLQIQQKRASLRTMNHLYVSWSGKSKDRKPMYHRICLALIALKELYFVLFGSYFGAPKLAEEWRETYTVFILDLTQTVDSIKF